MGASPSLLGTVCETLGTIWNYVYLLGTIFKLAGSVLKTCGFFL